jgi:hypothetical protein
MLQLCDEKSFFMRRCLSIMARILLKLQGV